MSRFDAYHEHPAVSSHKLADFCKEGPLYFYRKHIQKTIPDYDRAAFTFGRALHALTLEGEQALWSDFVTAPDEHLAPSGGLSTKAATREWKAEQSLSVLTPNDVTLCFRMAAAVRSCSLAAKLLSTGKPEVERFDTHRCGLQIKGRADWHAGAYGLDLKSCRNLDDFEADARRYGYVGQGAFYRALFGWSDFYLVAAEKEGANRVGVYRVEPRSLDEAHSFNDVAMHDLSDRYERDEWGDDSLKLVG